MIFTELTAPLTDDFEGDTVIIQSNMGRAKDKNWVRNFTKAKELASVGRVNSIVARSVVTKESLHSFYALRDAVGAGHPLLSICVTGERPGDVEWLKEKATKLAPLTCCDRCECKPRRGRPKGSKNRPKVDENAVLEWLAAEEQYNADVVAWLQAEKGAGQ